MRKTFHALISLSFIFILCTRQTATVPGTVLFQDPLDGRKVDGWIIAPANFVSIPDHGTALKLEPTRPDSFVFSPWVGNSTWDNYRIEVEMLVTNERKGFIGIQFHIQEDSVQCCNLGFYVGGEIESDRYFETSVHYNKANLSWKLWPFSQKSFRIRENEWLKLRMDIGPEIANVYLNGDSTPVYTTYDLPFKTGGIRFWQYGGRGLLSQSQSDRFGGRRYSADPRRSVERGRGKSGEKLASVAPDAVGIWHRHTYR
jgi:hypothetical protein